MEIQDCEEFPCQVVYAGIPPAIRPLSALFARRTSMRQTRKSQLALGEARIEDIKLDHKSRDDIPAVLLGLQHLYSHEQTREKLFSLLEEHILPGTNRNVGRPGMERWRILVMGVIKQGLGCDFDRVHEFVNQHRRVREFLGHGAFSQDDTYELQTIIDNVYLLTPELLSEIGRLVVESGHAVARKKSGEPLRGRGDSFVVETDVHYPTDVNLLWDAMRCLLRELGRAARKHHIGGWRQWRHLTREVKKCFNQVRSTRRAKSQPDRVEAYFERCGRLVDRAEESLEELEQAGGAQSSMVPSLIVHARRQIDQVERRLLKGETIARTTRRCFRFSRTTPAGSRRARRAVRWNSEFPYAWLKTNSSSSFTTGFCGKGAIPILRCRSSTRRRHCIPTYGCAASTVGSTVPTTGCSSTQCSTSMHCRARVGFLWPSASARKRKRSPRQDASTRRSSRQSTTSSIAVSTGCAPTAPMGLHTPLHCRYWPPTCTASACSCDGACVRPKDVEDAARPERGHLLRIAPPRARHTETGTAFGARKSEMRAGWTPSTVQWCRCGGFRGRNLAEGVAVRRRFRAEMGVFWQTRISIECIKTQA